MRILLIEDESDVATQIKLGLQKHFIVDTVDTGSDGIFYAQMNDYDVTLIDIGLPDMSGTEVCRLIRQSHPKVGILMLTANYELGYKVSSLDLGADDYITKPFSFAELISRIKAVYRRTRNVDFSRILKFDNLELNLENQTVTIDGTSHRFTKKEYKILEYLMVNKGKIVGREELLRKLWEHDEDLSSNTVDVHMRNLRKKLFSRGLDIVETIYGFGYRIKSN